MAFPVVTYGWEIWTIRKAEHQRIDALELWCWRRLLRVSWTARRSIKSILKEISPEYSLEGLMLKMKLQYFGHLMRKIDFLKKTWCWERLKAEEGDDRVWDGWIVSPTWWTWVLASSRVGEGQGSLHPAVYGVAKSWTQLSNWSELWDIRDTSQILNINVSNFSPEQEERQTLNRSRVVANNWWKLSTHRFKIYKTPKLDAAAAAKSL